MTKENIKVPDQEKFKFLDKTTASEPHIYEVLNAILMQQNQSLPSGATPLATFEFLKNSRSIKIPFSTTSEKTLDYILKLLIQRFPGYVRPIITFQFEIDETTKKLSISETEEYTVQIDDEAYNSIVAVRDKKSIESLFELLKKYRFFNISKLIKMTENKADLTRIIKNELGKNIFTFKNFSIDKNKIELAEEYCFHTSNYESVKKSLVILGILKNIVSVNSEIIKRALARYGILNAEFSDYRDSKLSYIFNILLDEHTIKLGEKDSIHVKNIQSLVSCLIKTDKLLNPVIIINEHIIKFVRENKICSETDLTHGIMDLSPDLLKKWATPENLKDNRIIYHKRENAESYLLDGASLYENIIKNNQLIIHQPVKMNEMTAAEKMKTVAAMDLMCEAAAVLFNGENINDLLNLNDEKLAELKNAVTEYVRSKQKEESGVPGKRKPQAAIENRSILSLLGDFFLFIKRLFTMKKKIPQNGVRAGAVSEMEISTETKSVYQKIARLYAPIIPLSDLIALTTENSNMITKIIEELYNNNLKIAVPVYDARMVLYPKRSRKLLLPDIEYLLVSPALTHSADDIRKFTDSMLGYKLKDDPLSSKALMVIEKYLLTIHRQKKRSAKKR